MSASQKPKPHCWVVSFGESRGGPYLAHLDFKYPSTTELRFARRFKTRASAKYFADCTHNPHRHAYARPAPVRRVPRAQNGASCICRKCCAST